MQTGHVLGVDIGGSGMKAAVVDLESGQLTTDRFRIATPQPANPHAMAEVFDELVAHFAWQGPIGCTFPGVVRGRSVIETAANLDSSWVGVDAAELFAQPGSPPIVLINDADAAGLAEVARGVARGVPGVVFMLTIGTGLGTALFNQGTLVPNTELGHIEIDGVDAEETATSRAKERDGLTMDQWAPHLDRYLGTIEDMLSPDLFVIGGGISKNFDEFAPLLHTRARVVPASLRNHAGIVGAAMAAVAHND